MREAIARKQWKRSRASFEYLQARNDTIVPLSKLLNTTRDALMPPLPGGQTMSALHQQHRISAFARIEEFLWAFMIVATALVVVRTLIVIYLAYRFRRSPPVDFAEPASVVIAAYNEGKVIAATLHSLLKTDYQGELDVIVVDDGSRDDTAAEVEKIAATDARVRLIRQENHGKARALATRNGRGQARNSSFSSMRIRIVSGRPFRDYVEPFSDSRHRRSIWPCQSR